MYQWKRVVLVLFIILLIPGVSLFAAGDKEEAAPVQVEEESGLSGKLTLWTFVPPFQTYYEKSVPMIVEKYPEVEGLDLEVVVIGIEELYDKVNASYLSGKGMPDLVDVEIQHAGRFFKPNQPVVFADLTEKFENSAYYDDIVLARTAPYTFDGKIYAIDCDMSATFLFYRKDIFDKYGIAVPETWDEFIEAGLRLKKEGIYMVQLSSGQNPQVSQKHELVQLMRQNDGYIFDENGNVVVDSAKAEEALQLYHDMVNVHGIATTTYASTTDPTFYAEIAKGNVATIYYPNWFVSFQMAGSLPDQAGLWRAANLPAFREGGRRTSTTGGTSLMITNAAKDRGTFELAWRFYEFNMMTKEGGLLHNSVIGWFPPIKSALKDPQMLQPVEYLGGQKFGELFFDIMDEIPQAYNSPYMTDAYIDVCKELIYPVLYENVAPKDALSNMAEHLEKMMAMD